MLAARVPSIETDRLELRSMSADVLEALRDGRRSDVESLLGVRLPDGDWPGADQVWMRLRLDQLRRDPSIRPWLSRAMVLHGAMIGVIGFHDRPDAEGRVEIGYEVAPGFRRQGFALEAVRALVGWAFQEPSVEVVQACISPANAASLALIRHLPAVNAGTVMDEIDGEEIVFELRR